MAVSLCVSPLCVGHLHLLELVAQQQLLELGLLLDVGFLLAVFQLVERRLGDVDVAGLDQLRHLAVEEGEHQGADVGAVDVGVGHQHDLVVARLFDVELLADAGADRGDQRLDLVVGEDLVDPRLLDVDDLAAQRQHRLGVAIAALLGRAAGGITLDDEQLGQGRVADGAVGELARQGRVLQRRLAAGQVARLAGRLAGAGGIDCLADDPFRLARVLLEELAELAVDRLLDQALDRRVAELGLGLTLELRVGQLDRDHRGQPLAHVVAGEVLVFLFEQAFAARVGVERAGQRRAEAGEVGAALVGVDVVGEAEDRFLVGGVPLHRHLDLAVVGLVLEEDRLAVQRVLVLVEVGDEVDDAALVVEGVLLARRSLVDQLDLEAAGEEGGLAQALGQGRVVELELVEDLVVGQEGDRGAVRIAARRRGEDPPAACRARSPGSRPRRRG